MLHPHARTEARISSVSIPLMDLHRISIPLMTSAVGLLCRVEASRRTRATPVFKKKSMEAKLAEQRARDLAADEARERIAQREMLKQAREEGFTLVIRDLQANNLPNADSRPGGASDPYVCFTLLEHQGRGSAPTAETPPVLNTNDPVWRQALSLRLPPNSKAALSRKPLLQIHVAVRARILDAMDEPRVCTCRMRTPEYDGCTTCSMLPCM